MDCVRKFPELFEVVGVVEDDPVQRELIKHNPTYSDYPFLTEEQLFNAGCDCIMVEGFELDLPYVAKRCVEQGIAVHIDKPAGQDLQVFEDTLRIAKKNHIQTVSIENRYDNMMLDFAKMVRGEKENPYTYEYELQLQKLVLAACGQEVDYKTKIVL